LPRRGRGPTKLFWERSRYSREVRLSRDELIWPDKLWAGRLSPQTRYGRVEVHVTPFHRQKWELMFQLLKTPNGSLVTPCLKWSNERAALMNSWGMDVGKSFVAEGQQAQQFMYMCVHFHPGLLGWYTCHLQIERPGVHSHDRVADWRKARRDVQ
jgi:hypothetical protein